MTFHLQFSSEWPNECELYIHNLYIQIYAWWLGIGLQVRRSTPFFEMKGKVGWWDDQGFIRSFWKHGRFFKRVN